MGEVSYSIEEQETIVNISRSDDFAIVFSTNRSDITRIRKLVEDSGSDWELVRDEGTLIEARCPKSLISFRRKVTKRDLTEEQKAELIERLHGNG